MLGREDGKRIDDACQSRTDELQCFAMQEEIGVVGDKTACSAEMDNGPSVGTLISVGVNMGHYVVAQLALILCSDLKIDVVDMGLELSDLFR